MVGGEVERKRERVGKYSPLLVASRTEMEKNLAGQKFQIKIPPTDRGGGGLDRGRERVYVYSVNVCYIKLSEARALFVYQIKQCTKAILRVGNSLFGFSSELFVFC